MTVEHASSSSSARAYEAHLTSLTLEDLLAEPDSLQTQGHHLTSSLTSLTHTSYPTFLSVHQSTKALSASLTELSDSLTSLVATALPALQDAAAAWHTRTTDVLRQRSKARLVLDQHDKLKDLLDVPIFIDSCVRNGYFQEALSVANHIATLASRPGAPTILASVHVEVKIAIGQMLVVLLHTLNDPGRKLPALWKAVNFLRRMDVFAEGEASRSLGGLAVEDAEQVVSNEELLVLAFLSGRLSCLSAILEPISRDIQRVIQNPSTFPGGRLSDYEKEDVARHLKKYIDVWREGAYDIITQYSTIFLEHQNPYHPKSSPPPKSVSISPLRQSEPPITQAISRGPSMLHILCPHLLSYLIPVLQDTLPSLSLSLLPSLLTQLTYCATAFTRAGMDFRSVISDIVSKAVATIVCQDLRDVGNIMCEGKFLATTSKTPSEWLVQSSLVDSPPLPPDTAAAHTPVHIPPHILASYPPLAKHTNAFLGILNTLRLLAPVAIIQELAAELDGVLAACGNDLIEYLGKFNNRQTGGDGVDREAKIAQAAGDVYFQVFVPFMRRALVEGVYGADIEQFQAGDEGKVRALEKVIAKWEGLRN